MHHGHLRTLCLAALRVQQPASVRQVAETIASVTDAPGVDSVTHTLLALYREGAVSRRVGRPVTYRLTARGAAE